MFLFVYCSTNKYEPLSLSEILKYQDDPWWNSLRRLLLVSFWICLVGMLFSGCFIAAWHHGRQCVVTGGNGVAAAVGLPTINDITGALTMINSNASSSISIGNFSNSISSTTSRNLPAVLLPDWHWPSRGAANYSLSRESITAVPYSLQL